MKNSSALHQEAVLDRRIRETIETGRPSTYSRYLQLLPMATAFLGFYDSEIDSNRQATYTFKFQLCAGIISHSVKSFGLNPNSLPARDAAYSTVQGSPHTTHSSQLAARSTRCACRTNARACRLRHTVLSGADTLKCLSTLIDCGPIAS